MRVAFLAPEFIPAIGGVGTYSIELVKRLSNDVEIHLFTPYRGYDIKRYLDKKVVVHYIGEANGDFFYNLKFQLGLFFRFPKLHKKYRFDLVHAANLVHMPDIFLKLRRLKIPTITTIHTTLKSQTHCNDGRMWRYSSTAERCTNLFYPVIKILEKFYIARTKNMIAVSQWIKDLVNTKNKNVKVIHNGINVNKFSHGKPGFFDFGDRQVVLFSGRLLGIKGLNLLINSAKEVLKEKDCLFVIAGGGNIDYWKKKAQSDRIIFLGKMPLSAMPHLYYHADIFVLPSYGDSFPLTLLEAMASETAVIASNAGGIPEIISNNYNGLLFNVGDYNTLVNSIIKLLRYSKLRNRLSKNAKETVSEKFNIDLMANKTLKFYKEVSGCDS